MTQPTPFPGTRQVEGYDSHGQPIFKANATVNGEESRFLDTMGDVADKVVGGLFRGVGYAGYHVHRVPVVKQATGYVGICIREGYEHAERSATISKMVKEIHAMRSSGNVSSETIIGLCRDRGLNQEAIDRVLKIANAEAGTGHEPVTVSA